MRVTTLLILGVLAALGAVIPTHKSDAAGETIYGVTADTLQRFDSANPGTSTTVGLLTGLQAGESIRAIDFRPATRELYGIGSTGRLYKINTTTAVATQVGAPFALTDPVTVGMDFNPVADRIRVVTDADENFRLDPDTGAVSGTDANLAYDAVDANSGTDPSVLGIGYTNNFAGASSTTLYGIDIGLDVLVRQGGVGGTPSPNLGTLHTIGPLGLNAFFGRIGLDITAGNTAFALFEVLSFPRLYTINLATGAASSVGVIGSPFLVIDIAVKPPAAFGDIDCEAPINSVDALKVLRANAALSYTQVEPCENIGVDTLPNGELQGDVDCSNVVNAVDALKLLRFAAGLTYAQDEPCPNIGT